MKVITEVELCCLLCCPSFSFFLFLGEGRDGVGEQNNGRCQILAILFSVPGYLAIVYIVNILVQ